MVCGEDLMRVAIPKLVEGVHLVINEVLAECQWEENRAGLAKR